MNDVKAPQDSETVKESWWTPARKAEHSARLKAAMERSRREAGAPKPIAIKPQRIAGQPNAKSRAAHSQLVAGIWELVRLNPVREAHLYEIGRQIRRYRSMAMSVVELADSIGLSESDVMGIENGNGYMLTPEIIAAICEELEVPPTFILTNVSRRGAVDV